MSRLFKDGALEYHLRELSYQVNESQLLTDDYLNYQWTSIQTCDGL